MNPNPLSPLALALALSFLTGCATYKKPAMLTPIAGTGFASENASIETSLFPSDQAVLGDEAVNRILSSRLELPARSRLAIMRFPQASARYRYRDEDFIKLQERQVESLTYGLKASPAIAEVMPLPSLMTPRQVSIPVLREAAVRLQADLLLVFRIASDTYSQYRVLTKDKVKSYSTCEVVLLDVRTGLVPFSRVITRERTETKRPEDMDLAETMRHAEQDAAMDALTQASNDLVNFIGNAPRRSN